MSQYEEISSETVHQKLKDNRKLNIIDVREDEEFSSGHIPGAKSMPLGQIPSRVGELNKDEEYIMVCRSGGRSSRASEWLAEQGFRVKNMTGGMLGWPGETEK
ncbi:rhodanese-like domain-containing protein [Aneurinibacillus sp. Ricciae_BoGa-3]|uniref:rhodanese-like domain-containing protein n=1 Tax=Aneurinibacillus sp. Ricciae_BoGa-3 TaxID=3022697 RepID=UPI002340E074|nr:rhodanese-like domain-containing protein [Aneurinibacillus sp. Ricciae_BoGa-3]WCK56705.1 rhodanese-like domain-containing protein [Aneurinibacillus sp. Ricciae_BoGa-3]